MNLRNQQIKSLYEQGIGVDEISTAFPELSVEAIKLCLMGCSIQYRKEQKKNEELFGEDSKLRAKSLIDELMDDPECPHNVKYKAAIFTINEVKGRNDVKKMATNVTNNLNVNILNAHLQKVEEVYKKAKEQKVIEMPKEQRELLEAS